MITVPHEMHLTHASLGRATECWLRKTGRRAVQLPEERSVGLWLYVARRVSDGVLKVGVSSNPVARVRGLWHRNQCGFEPLGFLPRATMTHEDSLLRMLFPFTLPGGREWFRDCAETRLFAWQIVAARDASEADAEERVTGYALKDCFRSLGEFIAGGYVEPTYLDASDNSASEMAAEDALLEQESA